MRYIPLTIWVTYVMTKTITAVGTPQPLPVSPSPSEYDWSLPFGAFVLLLTTIVTTIIAFRKPKLP